MQHSFLAATLVLGATPFALFLVAWLWYRRSAPQRGDPPPQVRKERL